jgi:dTDP-4-amino-4,6-dideoxygalactose transaminase
VDVEPDTLTIDPVQVERAITPRTKAILPVHLYGHPCDMDRLLALAQQHQLAIVEDAAHAFPTRYKGRMIGSPSLSQVLGERAGVRVLTAFSFYATKNLTTAEGGMLTGDPDIIEQARLWSLHGMSRDAYKRYSAEGSWYYEVVLPGYKCNMTDIQAALGVQQLRKIDDFQARRRAIVQQYHAALASLPELQIPTERADAEHAWHIYALRLNLERLTIDRARFIEELKERHIGTSVHFIPIHLHPYYRDKYGWRPEDFPIAYREYRRLISLPLYPRLSDQDVADVIEAVSDVVEKYRKG